MARDQSAPASRRRPRRSDVVTYRARVDLEGTEPPLWRGLELASDLFLDEVHDVIQDAFGWTDSHLHRFGSGPAWFSDDTEFYLCDFEVDEGETGVPEEQVRLDEVLVDVGDTLLYLYDFGDDWDHVIRLEAVSPRYESTPRAVCTDGRRPGPAEDCGGAGGYELIVAATDPSHVDHAASVAEFARRYGAQIDPAAVGTTPFDVDDVNDRLAALGLDHPPANATLPEPVDELVHAVQATRNRRRLRRLIDTAVGSGRPQVDREAAERMVRWYRWLLERVGDDGIKLTGAGHLPPAHVVAAAAAMDPEGRWYGKSNREEHTPHVRHLRESAQTLGLLRKYRGMLLPTALGKRLRDDPVRLWWHIAERTPPTSKDPSAVQAGLLLLIAIAAGMDGRPYQFIADVLDAIGWMDYDDSPPTSDAAYGGSRGTRAQFRLMDGFPDSYFRRGERPTPDGRLFARAALHAWPTR